MIEKIILDYLTENIDIPSYLERPEVKPERCILFEKTSGGKENLINSATFAFQSYGTSLYDSALINEELKEVIEKMVELPDIGGVKFNTDYNFTNPRTKEYRYQAVFDIYF